MRRVRIPNSICSTTAVRHAMNWGKLSPIIIHEKEIWNKLRKATELRNYSFQPTCSKIKFNFTVLPPGGQGFGGGHPQRSRVLLRKQNFRGDHTVGHSGKKYFPNEVSFLCLSSGGRSAREPP